MDRIWFLFFGVVGFSAGGTAENSPAFQRWDNDTRNGKVPEGRLNLHNLSTVPPGLKIYSRPKPSAKALGYFRMALRAKNQFPKSCPS